MKVFELWQRAIYHTCHQLHAYSLPGTMLSILHGIFCLILTVPYEINMMFPFYR